ncbi:hypothetical protein BJY01DRAFT_225020 [Aspergillus pseudoustus]|uniref:HNH nuclease domain-containing protein n=1 Tax=Aspergillus pseudoustus TaxID=1810923 RepID=A0ABR4J225_9EURO
MDVFPEVKDPLRVRIMERLAKQLLDDDEKIEPGLWAFLWLSDVDQVKTFADHLISSPPVIVRAVYSNTMWTKALRTWATRDHGEKETPAAAEESPKRKLEPDTQLQPSKIPRPAAGMVPVPRGRSRSRSPSKLPVPGPIGSPVALTPNTPTTPAPSYSPTTPLASAPGSLKGAQDKKYRRSAAAADKCRQRDGDACLITRGGDCNQIVHIYPYLLGRKAGPKGEKEFWRVMSTFWSAEEIKKWGSAILGPKRTEVVQNLLSLAPTVHALWGQARFALKPLDLSPDRRRLSVQFYWLDQTKFVFKDLATPPSPPTNLDSTARGTRLFDCASQRCIRSGDVLTWTTDDPETMPLPSIELLHLQWCLNRLISLSAAADVTDEELDPEDPTALAPPISVRSDDEISWSDEEDNEGEEEEDMEDVEEDSQETGDLQAATAASSAAEVPRVGENRPLAQAGAKGSEDAIENPLVLRTRNRNVY